MTTQSFMAAQWAVVTMLILIGAWTALGSLPPGAEGHMPLPYLIALQRFLWMPLAVCAVIAAAMQSWVLVLVCVVLLPAVLRGTIPYYRGILGTRARTQSKNNDGRGNPIRMATLNCRFGRADPRAIVDLVRRRHVDVLALQELTTPMVAGLDAAGLPSLLPFHCSGMPRADDNGGFNAIWSRLEPLASSAAVGDIHAADVPAIIIAPDGSSAPDEVVDADRNAINTAPRSTATADTILVVSAHPKSPMRGCAEWSAGIRALRELATPDFAVDVDAGSAADSEIEHIGFHHSVVLGDLNSGLDHPSFRSLLNGGDKQERFHDATLSLARGLAPTYPSWLAWPRIALDHALMTVGLSPNEVHAVVIPGSDHLALITSISINGHH